MIKIEDIRQELVQLGAPLENLKNKKKGELLEMLEAAKGANVVLNTLEIIEDKPKSDMPPDPLPVQTTTAPTEPTKTEPPIEKSNSPISITDPGWTKSVLDQLTDDEKDGNGNPKADGLRRIANKFFGPLSIESTVRDCPSVNNSMRAVVTVKITTADGNPNAIQHYVTGSADCYSGNTDRAYAVHAVATAETRAEGRALRKLLVLTKVNTAEEMLGAGPDTATGTDGKLAPEGQINGLKEICKMVNIDINKLVANEKFDLATIDDMTIDQAKRIVALLSDYREGRQQIPDNIKA